MALQRFVLVPAVAWFAACSDQTSTNPESADSSALTLPACTWSASLDPADASGQGCRAARALLSCQYSNGVGQGCISDDPTQCPGPSAQPGVSVTCHGECSAHEYGVACGSVGGPSVQPPAGCHDMQATPGGVVFYCCPCAS